VFVGVATLPHIPASIFSRWRSLILLPLAVVAIAEIPLEELPPPIPRFQRSLKSLDGVDLLEPNANPGFEEELEVVPGVFDA